jgi:outer membrane protein OmpA-like peptidoglycan-associated protein
LREQADWIAKYPIVNVLVAGNTDERGTETYNLAPATTQPPGSKTAPPSPQW